MLSERYKPIYKSIVSPEELSRYFKEEGNFSIVGYEYSWWILIGGLITCPICGKKAVIIPYGVTIPIEKSKYVPCHCAVSLDYGYICYHWCNEELGDLYENMSTFDLSSHPSFRNVRINKSKGYYFYHKESHKEESEDITKSFKVLIRDSFCI